MKSNFAPEYDKEVDIQNTSYILHLKERKCFSCFKQDLLNASVLRMAHWKASLAPSHAQSFLSTIQCYMLPSANVKASYQAPLSFLKQLEIWPI